MLSRHGGVLRIQTTIQAEMPWRAIFFTELSPYKSLLPKGYPDRPE